MGMVEIGLLVVLPLAAPGFPGVGMVGIRLCGNGRGRTSCASECVSAVNSARVTWCGNGRDRSSSACECFSAINSARVTCCGNVRDKTAWVW